MITFSLFILAGLLSMSVLQVANATRRSDPFERADAFVPGARVVMASTTRSRKATRISKKLSQEIDAELPDLVELMSVVLLSGQSIQAAIEVVANRGSGKFSDALRAMRARLALGQTIDVELAVLCVNLPTAGVREFSSKLAIAINRGTPLATSLANLSQTLRRRAANQLLRQAGANETKMLIPLVSIVLPITVIFALYPSAQVLQLGF